MIIFDLICGENAHQFEGWFSSSSDYEDQRKSKLLSCPICGCSAVEKAMMAPNVGAKSNQLPAALPSKETPVAKKPSSEEPVSNSVAVPAEYKELVGKLAKAQEKLLKDSKWVGDKFADEARAIYYGDKEAEQIHGTASGEEAAALEEEGVEIAPLPIPVTPPEAQN